MELIEEEKTYISVKPELDATVFYSNSLQFMDQLFDQQSVSDLIFDGF